MPPAKFVQPWEIIEIDFQDMVIKFSMGNRCLLLTIDKASRYLFTYPIKTREADAIANHVLNLCLTFGAPAHSHSDGGGEPTPEKINYVYRRLKGGINYGPVDRPRGKDAVERAGA